jgi:hypothetical protein
MNTLILLAALAVTQCDPEMTAQVATQGAMASIELESSTPAPAPQPPTPTPNPSPPPPTPDGSAAVAPTARGITWPHNAVRDAIDQAKQAFVQDVKRIAESAQVQASVRVTFPENPRTAASPQVQCGPRGCRIPSRTANSPSRTANTPSSPPSDYADALAVHRSTGEPFAVLVGVPECGACETAKAALPRLAIPHAYLDANANHDLVIQNLREVPRVVPVLVIFYRDRPTERLEWPQLLGWLEDHSQ